MKKIFVSAALICASACVWAQSTVSISGWAKLGVVKGNDGTSPVDMNPATGTRVNDNISNLTFSGKEDLGGGMYAGFAISTFTTMDVGGAGAVSSPFWGNQSVLKVGGGFGEVYLGRALTPAALMVLFYDPWYWDGSPAQVGWGIQQANYYSTAGLRTNNTIGYKSPNFGGITLSLAHSLGESSTTVSSNTGGSLTYSNGPLSLGLAYDQHKPTPTSSLTDRMTILAASYDFGAVKPMATFTSTKVNDVSYKSFSVSATAPIAPTWLAQFAFASLNDFDTATSDKETLRRISGGVQNSLSKRTQLYANISQSKAKTRTATNSVELGINHNF